MVHESFAQALDQYDFTLPPKLIAQAPASPRDSARLLVYDRQTGERHWSTFADIIGFLPKNALLVLNETKVIPARLHLKRSTGGGVAVLCLGSLPDGTIRVLANRKLNTEECLTLDGSLGFTVVASAEKEWILRPSFPLSGLPDIFDRFGAMPLPPYIKHSPLSNDELKREYQTVFAKDTGSIAAPTASLHFTEQLLKDIESGGRSIARVTLHVHLGTFAPLTEEQWKNGELHHETYFIDAVAKEQIESAKKSGRPVIAVGTTVVRTLESASDEEGRIVRSSGDTSLFIREGYKFHLVDGLITNFHVPRSSLLMLVSALTGREKLMELYCEAMEKKMRFYSFGDGMLIL